MKRSVDRRDLTDSLQSAEPNKPRRKQMGRQSNPPTGNGSGRKERKGRKPSTNNEPVVQPPTSSTKPDEEKKNDIVERFEDNEEEIGEQETNDTTTIGSSNVHNKNEKPNEGTSSINDGSGEGLKNDINVLVLQLIEQSHDYEFYNPETKKFKESISVRKNNEVKENEVEKEMKTKGTKKNVSLPSFSNTKYEYVLERMDKYLLTNRTIRKVVDHHKTKMPPVVLFPKLSFTIPRTPIEDGIVDAIFDSLQEVLYCFPLSFDQLEQEKKQYIMPFLLKLNTLMGKKRVIKMEDNINTTEHSGPTDYSIYSKDKKLICIIEAKQDTDNDFLKGSCQLILQLDQYDRLRQEYVFGILSTGIRYQFIIHRRTSRMRELYVDPTIYTLNPRSKDSIREIAERILTCFGELALPIDVIELTPQQLCESILRASRTFRIQYECE